MNPTFAKFDLCQRLLVVLAAALACVSVPAAAVGSFQDGAVSVKVAKETGALAIDLALAAGQPAVRITLGSAVTQVKSIQRAGDKLVVMGDLGAGGATEVSIFDLASRSLSDRFWAIAPALSPDGQWVAFVRFYPMGGVSGVESQYRLYSLAQSPVQNRAAFAGVAAGDIGPSALQDVGFALYPRYVGQPAPDNVGVADRQRHQHASGLFWSADSKRVGFVDVQGGRARTVVTTLAADASVSSVRSAGLPALGKLCLAGMASPGCRAVDVESVRLDFDAAGQAVRVNLPGSAADKLAPRALDLPLKSFVTAE